MSATTTTAAAITSADLVKAVRTAADSILSVAAVRRSVGKATAAAVAARIGGGNTAAADKATAAAIDAVGSAADTAAAAIAVVAGMTGTRLSAADAAAAGLDKSANGGTIATLLTASVNGTGAAGKAVLATFATPKG